MKKILSVIFVSLFPTLVSAQGLVPCGNPGQQPCQFNHILELISNVINFVFIMIVPIAAVLFMWWGFRYMISSDDAQLRQSLKTYFKNLIIGIIIVMAAWLVIATLLRALGVSDAYVLLKL